MTTFTHSWEQVTLAVGLYANAVLIASNFFLLMRLRKGPRRPRRSYRVPRTASSHPYPLSPSSAALVCQLIRDLDIHFQNRHHEFFDGIREPSVPEIVHCPWSDGQEGTNFSNLSTPEISLQWHVAPGLYCFSDREFTVGEWAAWYDLNLSRIVAAQ